jgi:hypothetical protein
MIGVFIVGIITLGIYKLVELHVRHKERLRMIERLIAFWNDHGKDQEPLPPLKLPDLSFDKQNFVSWSLKLSLLLMGVGIGCALTLFVRFGVFADNLRFRDIEMLNASFILIFGGLGLLIAYLIDSKQNRNK